jgi:hypothetical protein
MKYKLGTMILFFCCGIYLGTDAFAVLPREGAESDREGKRVTRSSDTSIREVDAIEVSSQNMVQAVPSTGTTNEAITEADRVRDDVARMVQTGKYDPALLGLTHGEVTAGIEPSLLIQDPKLRMRIISAAFTKGILAVGTGNTQDLEDANGVLRAFGILRN